ncbi:MAG: hypothetical protein ACMXYL_05685 [Candidatus Woesearchaeota archaeon]
MNKKAQGLPLNTIIIAIIVIVVLVVIILIFTGQIVIFDDTVGATRNVCEENFGICVPNEGSEPCQARGLSPSDHDCPEVVTGQPRICCVVG